MKEFELGQLMVCGCAAQGMLDGVPGCAIHLVTVPMDKLPDLTNRQMKCSYGGNTKPSDRKAAFFIHHPNQKYDEYYCGCWGWD